MDKNVVSQYQAINNKIDRLEQELKEAQESRRELINRYNLNKLASENDNLVMRQYETLDPYRANNDSDNTK